MNDYYTLKEVILGLRGEQVRIAKKLQDLNKYANVYGKKKCDNAHFRINGIGQLEYCYCEKINYLEKLLNVLLCDSDALSYGYNVSNSLKVDRNGKVYFTDEIFINDLDKDIFMRKANSLFNDEFIQKLIIESKVNTSVNVENQRLSFSLDATFCYQNYETSRGVKSNFIDYKAYNDLITVCLYYRNKSFKEHTTELLNLKFPKRLFSGYIQDIIDGSDERKKDIIVPDVKIYGGKADFYVNDERDALVLVKKR